MKEITVGSLQNNIAFQNNKEILFDFPISKGQEPAKGVSNFAVILENTVNDVNQLQREADESIQKLAAGKGKDIHQTMIALEKAEVSFQLMMQVRNKIIAAYEEVMRMQI